MGIFYLSAKFELDWCTNNRGLLSDRKKKTGNAHSHTHTNTQTETDTLLIHHIVSSKKTNF